MRIEYLHEFLDRIDLLTSLRAALELEQVYVAPRLRHMHGLNSRNGPVDQAVVAQDACTLQTLVGDSDFLPLITYG